MCMDSPQRLWELVSGKVGFSFLLVFLYRCILSVLKILDCSWFMNSDICRDVIPWLSSQLLFWCWGFFFFFFYFLGDVVLKDLKLKAEALNSLKLPVAVKSGFVGTITLKVTFFFFFFLLVEFWWFSSRSLFPFCTLDRWSIFLLSQKFTYLSCENFMLDW